MKFSKIMIVALFLSLVPGVIFAGTTGKIAGYIKDKDTGDPLPMVNVIIEGTTLGAATDENGYYFINNVPVGTYTVTARMMGYEPLSKAKVIVHADLTTKLNFDLAPTVIEVGEAVVVTAERPLVEPGMTASMRITTAEEIERLPARTFGAVVANTAGVLGSYIRGGRGDEVAWMIDGLQVDDPLSGGQALNLSNIAIEEVQVITGGFNAEYGEAMSGVINVVTKSGGPKTSVMYRLTTDKGMNILTKHDDLEFDYFDHEFTIGGPVPFTGGKLRYFTSAALNLRGVRDPRKLDNQIKKLYNDPHVNLNPKWYGETYFKYWLDENPKALKNRYWLIHNAQQRYEVTGKLTYNLTPTLQLKFGAIRERNQWEEYPWSGTGQTPPRSFYWVAEEYHSYARYNTNLWVGITHQISKRTFYELKINRFETNWWSGMKDVYKKNPDGTIMRDEFGRPIKDRDPHWWENYRWIPEKKPDGVESEYATYDWTNPRNPFGVYNNWQSGAASTRRYEQRFLSYIGAKFDITSQVTNIHQIKFGFEYRSHKAERHYNSLPWRPDPFQDHYKVYPKFSFLYLQDTAEWPGLILNAGLRFDYMAPQMGHRKDLQDRYSEKVKTKPKWKLSPRLGISHPISAKTVVHFQYGQFFQAPDFYDLFKTQNPYTARHYDPVGHPDLEAQKTIAYELGITHQLGTNTKLEVVSYYKDIFDLIGSRSIPTSPYPIPQIYNRSYGNARGIEFTFIKRMSNYWAAQATYTLSRSKGPGHSNVTAFLGPILNPETGMRYYWPERLFPNNLTRDHMFNVVLDIRFPENYGPKIFGVQPLENFGLDLIWRARSGWRYTRQNYRGEPIEENGASRGLWYSNTDLKVSRDFRLFGKYNLSLFAEIYNLFNRTNILGLHARTVDPLLVGDEREYKEANFSDGIDRYQSDGTENPRWRWERVKDLDGDEHISRHEEYVAFMKSFLFLRRTYSNFGPPRLVRVGFQLWF